MKNLFKRIWNYFFPEKKKDAEFKEALRKYNQETIDRLNKKAEDVIVNSVEKIINHSKPRTQLFRNQQLPGKVYSIGKSRFRIKKKIGLTASEKLRYEITQI